VTQLVINFDPHAIQDQRDLSNFYGQEGNNKALWMN